MEYDFSEGKKLRKRSKLLGWVYIISFIMFLICNAIFIIYTLAGFGFDARVLFLPGICLIIFLLALFGKLRIDRKLQRIAGDN